jgi:hypothetical protein
LNCKSGFTGGYFHGLSDLTYGVDVQRIRWCGILQVSFEAFVLFGHFAYRQLQVKTDALCCAG